MSNIAASTPSTSGRAKRAVRIAEPPEYQTMIKTAIQQLRGRSGSTFHAILQYVMDNYRVGGDATVVKTQLREHIDAAVLAGTLEQCKGPSAITRFKLTETTTGARMAAKAKVAVRKPAAKQGASPNKSAARMMKKLPKAARKSPAKKATKAPAKKMAYKPASPARKAAYTSATSPVNRMVLKFVKQ